MACVTAAAAIAASAARRRACAATSRSRAHEAREVLVALDEFAARAKRGWRG